MNSVLTVAWVFAAISWAASCKGIADTMSPAEVKVVFLCVFCAMVNERWKQKIINGGGEYGDTKCKDKACTFDPKTWGFGGLSASAVSGVV